MNKIIFRRNSDEWETPCSLFNELDKEFNFTLDPCSSKDNHKCKKYFTLEEDGLKQKWSGEIVFCNPPYSKVKDWVKKCFYENKENDTTIVLLVPSRTDTKWFHEYIYKKHEIRFLKGRLKFGGSKHNAPFPNMLVIFR